MLRQLQDGLITRGIRHRIILDEIPHEDDIARPPAAEGWVKTPRGKTELRRTPYLSILRNKALEPLAELAANGTIFDKVPFLNDVVFVVVAPSNLQSRDAELWWPDSRRLDLVENK